MKIITNRSLGFLMAIAVFLFGASTILATENTKVVNETSGGTFTNLQAAINAANSGDVLLLSGHFYGTFFIEQSLTLIGSKNTVLDGNNIVQVLNLSNGDAIINLENLTIQNGSSTNGGGILNLGTLTLNHCKVINNTAIEQGGGIANFVTFDDTLTGPGNLIIIDSEISYNTAVESSGGGIFSLGGTLTISNSKFKNNTTPVSGGGVDTESATTITNTLFKENTARYGGAINIEPNLITAVLDRIVCKENTATSLGGAISQSPNSSLTINFSNFEKNLSQGVGGAIETSSAICTINNSRITRNSAFNGGGIFQIGGTLIINQSIIEDNSPNDIAE